MKVVTSTQMAYIESEAYRNGSSEEEFMENAGSGVAEWVDFFIERENLADHVYLLCGKGNNAGDTFVAGCKLLEKGYSVLAYHLVPTTKCSPLCQINKNRFISSGGKCREITHIEEELLFQEEGVILDGLFGTGFQGIAREPFASAIKKTNESLFPILAVDIPSGLNGDTGIAEGPTIQATETLFLGLPKTGLFLLDGWNHVGKLRYVDFGLPAHYIEESTCDFTMIYPPLVKPYLPPIINNRHKYQAGYVIGLAGSPGMPGAALLSSLAALKSGAGIVKLLHPAGMEGELALSPFELIKVPYAPNDEHKILDLMNTASATFIGPGLGRSTQVRRLLREIFLHIKKPCVIDADALTLIAEENIPIPENAILTPHVGEMIRLSKQSTLKAYTREFLQMCQMFTEEHKITLVLKGGPSFIFHPGEAICVNPYGDPGMATAGSGDVLTGIIASLLGQGIEAKKAATLGVYLHGAAGEEAAAMQTSYCMIASDIIEHLPQAFWSLK